MFKLSELQMSYNQWTSSYNKIRTYRDILSTSEIISYKSKILGKLGLSRRTEIELDKLVTKFLNTYGSLRWTTKMSDKISIIQTLVDSNDPENFIMALEIICSCERRV